MEENYKTVSELYVDDVKKNLWDGHAAVMVGA